MPILEAHQIKFVDAKFIPAEATRAVNRKIKNAVLSGKEFTKDQADEEMRIATDSITNALQSMGNRRPFKPSDVPNKTWKSIMKDLEWDLEYNIVGEARDTQLVADNLIKILQFIQSKQGMPMSPQEELVFSKVLSMIGAVSPLELSQVQSPAMPVSGGQGSVAGQEQQLTPTQ